MMIRYVWKIKSPFESKYEIDDKTRTTRNKTGEEITENRKERTKKKPITLRTDFSTLRGELKSDREVVKTVIK